MTEQIRCRPISGVLFQAGDDVLVEGCLEEAMGLQRLGVVGARAGLGAKP